MKKRVSSVAPLENGRKIWIDGKTMTTVPTSRQMDEARKVVVEEENGERFVVKDRNGRAGVLEKKADVQN